ncbi:beige/BEACH domain-containing protein [Cordyceps militaris CM01]|uniref:Beige protein homolog 1 n=1 Tax=Cordyceps militaris (strain CM01) TaxID=983644 RepID=G3J398_CORMM|nr:beige/BEACH domain-containing protein [Cordyceps militaris CM01]EGX96479.1 beige/BEACH domain-containing protein [Cordyceps militaris CM01]
MSTSTRRYRSSTSASTPAAANQKSIQILRVLLDGLASQTNASAGNGYPEILKLTISLREVADYISASNTISQQDAFRLAGGFEAVLNILRSFSGFYDPEKRSNKEMVTLFQLLGATLDVFAAALLSHSGNKRFFKFRVEGGGWEALEQAIASIGLGGIEPNPWVSCHVFGKLFAFSLGDDAIDLLFQSIAETLRHDNERTADNADEAEPDEQWDLVLAKSMESIGPKVRELVQSTTRVQYPEMLRAIVSFWSSLPRDDDAAATPASLLVLETILRAAEVLTYNCAAIHSTGVMSQFLRVAFSPNTPLSDSERKKILDICRRLMFFGVDKPADTQFLLSVPGSEASEFCLEMMGKYHGPAFFNFDLSLHGHSSLELPSLGRPFPPQSSPGYTFTAWICIDHFDPSTHTTLFGAFDASQTCFVLMYLERDTHNFILQTSVFSNKPSIRFKSTEFREKKWYHIAIVHKRPKTMTASRAALYVNGEFCEQMRCNYPLTPPLSNNTNESFASFNSGQNKTNPVQAFIGTPRELSGQLGTGVVSSRWSLASAHLFEDVLGDDFLAVHYGLGPHYHGNFQDALGEFQTYEASAQLGLRNEIAHPGKDESSDILKAVRDKASVILPESKVLLSILPSATLPENVQFQDTGLLRSLPRSAARALFMASNKDGAPLAINSAVPNIADALFKPQGIASFRGSPTIALPSYLDENLWRLAGFTSLALKLLERATSVDETVRSLEIMFHCIRTSWRNSDAMERGKGYNILAMLLRYKMGYTAGLITENFAIKLHLSPEERDSLAFRVLSLVLGFVGYNHENPLDSLIINALAYRILLIDLDLWRKSAPRIQELYYKQFVTFAVNSKHHEFNSRRLIRVRIVKRLLDAMKGEAIPEEVLPHFMQTFEVLVKSNLSPEVMRSLSLFITYAFHVPSPSMSRTPRPLSSISRPTTPNLMRRQTGDGSGASSPLPGVKYLTKKQLGAGVLGIYSRILCEKGNLNYIRKFAKTVTNKWLLYLLAENDKDILLQGATILSRLLVGHGSAYTSKFANKSAGFAIMANRLKRFWYSAALWPVVLSLLFGVDVADLDTDRWLDTGYLLSIFGGRKVVYPDASVIIISMLQHGLNDVLKQDNGVSESSLGREPRPTLSAESAKTDTDEMTGSFQTRMTLRQHADPILLKKMVQLFHELYEKSADFRDFALTSDWVRLILSMLYPVVVSSDAVTPDVELHSRDSTLNFEGCDVIIRPIGLASGRPAPIVRTTSVDLSVTPQSTPPKGTLLKRASSFVLLTTQSAPEDEKKNDSMSRPLSSNGQSDALIESVLGLPIGVFMDQIFKRKEFSGFGLFTKVPPGFQEHQAYFESFVLKKIVTNSTELFMSNQAMLCEPKLITNMARLCLHLTEAVFEGWFIDGAEVLIEFAGMLLEYLQRPDVASLKSVRLCSQSVTLIRTCLLRVILLKLSDLDRPETTEAAAMEFMSKLAYWQMSILGCFVAEDEYLKLFWYQLYTKLVDERAPIRRSAAHFLRILLVAKPEESAALIRSFMVPGQRQIIHDFVKITELDDDVFIAWVDQNRPSLDSLFFGGMAKTWENFVSIENMRTQETAKTRLSKRKDKLKQWYVEGISKDKLLANHEIGNSGWMKSIYNSEHFKYQRILQDQQDDLSYLISAYKKMEMDLRRPGAVFSDPRPIKWKLDRTEGRNRMRLRLLPDFSTDMEKYRSKEKGVAAAALRVNTATGNSPSTGPATPTLATTPATATVGAPAEADSELALEQEDAGFAPEDDFELIEDPNDAHDMDENFEDKNRKVMRRLEQGDQVQAAYNVSRVTGLEACEGILIIGKDALYMMDNVFQTSTGDIVNVWQAPMEERDPFTRIVTGTKTLEKRQTAGNRDQESRNWKWQDTISISKRRFLFRDVAIEIFFTDGRSYLLTAINTTVRDEMFAKMLSKAPHTSAAHALPNPEDAWRLEALKNFEESQQGIGSKLGTLFNTSPWNPLMKRWQKGEMSNFHYLMMVNTMAGRTFNDLTQYPVFPWVLADFTSEELDLNNPATFRDLSKPMGAQTQERVQGFVETYNALKEIEQAPFHYGTHYSSAMIVSSYLIRLPPFVQSYLLLQGDSFDHADRLFQSIPDAWKSASCRNKTDVRELIPEFFCLPEFLTNVNGYDFGRRQSNGVKVDHVVLPPWAKGDPKIFIAKHREALESRYVSENLHRWIDLVFGFKQRGEAAVENLNVFHHLSYAGASDLDRITDANERAITAGVIHNFGQTPHQVFSKPHPARENSRCPVKRLDSSVQALMCLPNPLIESHERVASLIYASKLDRLLCASPFRLNLPPYDKFLEWGYADNTPAGLFENLHIGQISCACFADSRTLITAGEDCVVSVYTVITSPGKPVELVAKSSLFGHKTPITAIAVSKSFSTFVSVSADGQGLLWDLNQLTFIRKLPLVRPVECARINDVSGEILLCAGPSVILYTLNGSVILDQNVCTDPDDYVHACAFYEGAGNEWLENQLIFTGHSRGVVNVWRKSHARGRWSLEHLRRLDHVDYKTERRENVSAGITCISPMPNCVYTGDEDGRVVRNHPSPTGV